MFVRDYSIDIRKGEELLKRKYANRPDWKRILEKSYYGIRIDEEAFSGYVCYLSLDKVRNPLWVAYEKKPVCIVDHGYVWLQHFPLNGNYVLTSTFNDHGELVQCYFDIARKVGVTEESIPYLDDLYLDVVVLPDGKIFTLDEDELIEAYREGIITKEDYDFANQTADELLASIQNGSNYLLKSTEVYYEFIRTIKLLSRSVKEIE